MSAHLEVTLDMNQKGDVKYTGNEQREEGASSNDHGEERRDLETAGNDGVALEVLLNVPPRPGIGPLGQVDGVERECVDSLTRSVGEKQAFPALEGEEDEEGKVIGALGRGRDVVKEAEVRVGACGARLASCHGAAEVDARRE